MMIAPPPRCFMCGTARREARIAGKSVSSNAACHSASVVPSRAEPAARPTLLTRTSRPPNVSTARLMTSWMPGAVDTSACTVAIMPGRFAAASTSSAASASCSPPRAQSTTRQPSATSARALARPSPRLEPVMTATLSVRPKSIRLFDVSAAEIVQAPVHFEERHPERVLGDELLLGRQQVRHDEGDDGALDRRTLRERRRGLVVRGDEIGLTPADDRGHGDRVGETIEPIHVAIVDELRLDVVELFVEPVRGIGLAAEPAAADAAATERQVEARLLEVGKDRLLDLVQRHRPTCGAPRRLVERTRNLLDGALKWIVVDDGLEHECVVGIHPERHLLPFRPPLIDRRRYVERRDVAIEPAARAFEGAVVDETVADVDVQNLVERPVQQLRPIGGRELSAGQERRRGGDAEDGKNKAAHEPDHSAGPVTDAPAGSRRGRGRTPRAARGWTGGRRPESRSTSIAGSRAASPPPRRPA